MDYCLHNNIIYNHLFNCLYLYKQATVAFIHLWIAVCLQTVRGNQKIWGKIVLGGRSFDLVSGYEMMGVDLPYDKNWVARDPLSFLVASYVLSSLGYHILVWIFLLAFNDTEYSKCKISLIINFKKWMIYWV